MGKQGLCFRNHEVTKASFLGWAPTRRLKDVIWGLSSLFTDLIDFDDPLNSEAADNYRKNPVRRMNGLGFRMGLVWLGGLSFRERARRDPIQTSIRLSGRIQSASAGLHTTILLYALIVIVSHFGLTKNR